jgi:hypothetical protein
MKDPRTWNRRDSAVTPNAGAGESGSSARGCVDIRAGAEGSRPCRQPGNGNPIAEHDTGHGGSPSDAAGVDRFRSNRDHNDSAVVAYSPVKGALGLGSSEAEGARTSSCQSRSMTIN